MANWMIQCADRYLGPLYDYLHNRMYRFHVLQADETLVRVSKDGRPANSKSYMWVYRTGKGYGDNLKPLVEAFFVWAKEIQTSGRLTKGKTLEGINYCINQEEALKVFLDDGEVPLDNNATEGSLRSLCLHKHAWKLIDSIDGAQSSAIIYSITETAKANNLNPFRYLEYILTVMKEHQEDTDYRFMEELLPWSEQLPEICKSKTKTTNV